MHGRELSEDVQESVKVREWLELQIKFTELYIIKSALQQEIKNLKANTNSLDSYILPLQEEEAKRISKEIVSIIAVL
jgi:vacuolar-type H+-ATPase subunit D/Vma8